MEEFARAGLPVPALLGDQGRWRQVFVLEAAWGNLFQVQGMDDVRTSFGLIRLGKPGEPAGTLELAPRGEPAAPKLKLAFQQPTPDLLLLEGDLQGAVRIRLRRIDPQGYLLVNRGFHWVNEVPFNR